MKKPHLIVGAACLAAVAVAALAWYFLKTEKTQDASAFSGRPGDKSAVRRADSVPAIPAERDDVRRIVNPGTASTAERLRQVHALPDDLSAADREAVAR